MATSRLVIKNLPKHFTEDRLRKLSGEFGSVTDARLIRTDDRKKSRRFGFVGFKTAEEATSALESLNKTYIDTSKIAVEYAALQVQGRPWSRYSKGSSAHKRSRPELYEEEEKQRKKKKREKREARKMKGEAERMKKKREDDPGLREFLSELNTERTERSWAPEDVASLKKKKKKKKKTDEEQGEKEQTDADFFKSKMDGEGFTSSEEEEVAESSSEKDEEDEDSEVELFGTSLRKVAKPEKTKKKKKKRKREEEEEDTARKKVKQEEGAIETGRLFLRNLSYLCTEAELLKLAEPFGDVLDVSLPVDKQGRTKGFGFVAFGGDLAPSHAGRMLKELDKTVFQGRLVHILPGRRAVGDDGTKLKDLDDDTKAALPYKTLQLMKKREEANKRDSWNSLFIRSDTVMNSLSDRGYSKDKFLGKDAAVNLAVAETAVIAETKQWLEENGVNPEAFSGRRQGCLRSRKVLLIKNLPFSTTEQELRKLFSPFGEVERILLPPSHALAILEFPDTKSAGKAFKKLAYRRFKHVPIYLEWAPVAVFSEEAESKPEQEADEVSSSSSSSEEEDEVSSSSSSEDEPDAEDEDADESRTLFVKNLNFETRVPALQRLFEARPGHGVVSVSIPLKPNPKAEKRNQPKTLSKGFGFVEFETARLAQRALKRLQQKELEGHRLQLSFAKAGEGQQAKKKKKAKREEEETSPKTKASKRTKLIVKNLAFQANKQEIEKLFSVYGQIKSMRLPKKFGGEKHRGFAFIDFVTPQEAQNAYDALTDSHFYGRHLVIQWAQKDPSTLGEAQKQTKDQFLKKYKK